MSKADDEPNTLGIWVKSIIDSNGEYKLIIDYIEDILVLDSVSAVAYATEIFRAAAYAKYDEAILEQTTSEVIGLPINYAANIIRELRHCRLDLNQSALGLLSIEPGISEKTHKAYLRCSLINHSLKWQWDIIEAEQHATQVIQCNSVVELDNLYYKYLTSMGEMDQPIARAVVSDLAQWIK